MLLASSGVSGSTSKTYVDDVFSVQLRTGNGTSQSVTTGFQPDLIWTKSRSATTGHRLVDSTRGAGNSLESNSSLQQQSEATGITAFSSSGYSIVTDSDYNTSGAVYVDWCWKKAPKFFDVVTYTGNAANRTITHSLGQEVGMILIKRTDAAAPWQVYHSSLANTEYMILDSNAAKTTGATRWNSTAPTPSVFSLGADGSVNASGGTYVAYLFAHDTSADGIIQCGSFTTDASGNATVNTIGWEPQWGMFKASSGTGDWIMLDQMRGWNMTANDAKLAANTSAAEVTTTEYGNPTATGFEFKGGSASTTYIYTVIRRPNKPPTTGTQVYTSSTASGVITTGFPVDLHIGATRAGASTNHRFHDRLRGGTKELVSSSIAAESTVTDLLFDSNSVLRTSFASGLVNHFLKRAPGFFDVVCYTGTGVARTVNHNLGVVPELIIVKDRSGGINNGALDWPVYSANLGATQFLYLNANFIAQTRTGDWNDTTPTSVAFTVGDQSRTNEASANFVAYLFASLHGISKVGSYTGNGSSQTINCGFAAGARFILIKRTEEVGGDWYVWSSATGIVAANDPHLSLNTTAAEVTTDDSVDPNAVGFDVLQNTATNINVLNANYIFLAIA